MNKLEKGVIIKLLSCLLYLHLLCMFIVHQCAIQLSGLNGNKDQVPSREAMELDKNEESLALINDNFRAETLRSSMDHLNNEVIFDCQLKFLKSGVKITGGIKYY